MDNIKILNHIIGNNYPPFIVAEMSGNHNQSLSHAFRIIEAAARAGCHALKIQTYTADTMTLDSNKKEFFIDDKQSLWKGNSLYNLYQNAHTPWEWHESIFNRCKELGIIGFSTPFDKTSLDFLETLDVPLYKISSFENTDLPLIERIATTGKPMIISTGMATLSELDEAVKTARKGGCKKLILLKCNSSYPSLPEESNLLTICNMKELFNTIVGISDHTLGIGTAIASVALGARVIEKHFTISRDEGGVDSAFSMEPQEMKMLVEESYRAFKSLGSVQYGVTENEISNKRFRRSIYAVQHIEKGQNFSQTNIRILRPASGLEPKYYKLILEKKAKKTVKKGSPISWNDLI
ncbi:pseudaminic acid synthase [Candidatus Magnetomorum sp. HK-1]|nr:pseudaminic acid synthase [Candidatus Magnetomorum sp. HK-1]